MTPAGYVLAAFIAGGFLLYNNRRDPFEALKTLVDIHKDLPDELPQKALLRVTIATEIERLTTRLPRFSKGGAQSVPNAAPEDDLDLVAIFEQALDEPQGDLVTDASTASPPQEAQLNRELVGAWKLTKEIETERSRQLTTRIALTIAMVLSALAAFLTSANWGSIWPF
ncbi:hypothetical protein [Rhodococcus sp. ACT016]|uniref:hypothetical protein n=1 Tax=Rhodococcus sp. ACT016 TaxID=3134808 RepID=UPI003D2DF3E6